VTNNRLNIIIDSTALVLFAAVLFSGFSMGGGHRAPGSLLWGLDKHAWAEVHEIASYLLLTAMVAHLLLHARWIQGMACSDQKASPLRRSTGKILLAGAGLLLAASVVVPKLMGSENRQRPTDTRTPEGALTRSPSTSVSPN